MELPSCPACGQSVLDDDADECPFCGASMSGKPVKKKPQPAATAPVTQKPAAATAATAATAAKTEPTKTAVSPAAPAAKVRKDAPTVDKSAAAEDEDDAPFEIDAAATQRAVPLSPKPKKGRSHRIICPMCETPGFSTKKAAGRDVKCSNPDCLVPIFTAPPLEEEPKEEVEEEAPPAKSNLAALVSAVVVVLGLVGGAVWFLVIKSDEPVVDRDPNLSRPATAQGKSTGGPQDNSQTDPKPDPNEVDVTAQPPQLSPAQISALALKLMVEEARSRETPSNRKSLCRRLAAEAYAIVGDMANAREQLAQLKKVARGELPYYQIPPLVIIARHQLEAGDQSAAEATLAECLQLANKLPKFGEFRFQAVPDLAIALAAVGKTAEARQLLDRHGEADPLALLSAMLQSTRDSKSFDLDQEARRQPLVESTVPLWVATVRGLAFWGRTQFAQEFATLVTGSEARTDCFVDWAHTVLEAQPQPDQLQDEVDAAAAKLSPAGQARYYANVCMVWLSRQNQEAALAALDKANTALNSIKVPDEVILPKQDTTGIKALYTWKLPGPEPLRIAAVAACEIARAQSALQQTEQAQKSLMTSLKFLRGMAPSRNSAYRRKKVFDINRGAAMRRLLKEAFDLPTDARARIYFNNYRNSCDERYEAANARFRLQLHLMQHALDWGLMDTVWDDIRARSGLSPETERYEPYSNVSLPKVLAARFRIAGEVEKADEVDEFVGNSGAYDPRLRLQQATAVFFQRGDLKGAARQILREQRNDLSKDGKNKAWRNQWTIQVACQLVKMDKAPLAFEFIDYFSNALLREKAFVTIGGLTGRLGKAHQAWSFVTTAKLDPTDKVAICRGLVEGIAASAASQQAL